MAVSVKLAGGVSEEYGNLSAAHRKRIVDLVHLYYEKARSFYRGDAQFGNLSLDVMTPGSTKNNKHFNFLSKYEGSKGTWEHDATAMVLIACRVVFYEEQFPKISFNSSMAQEVRDLVRYLQMHSVEEETILAALHSVLASIFLKKPAKKLGRRASLPTRTQHAYAVREVKFRRDFKVEAKCPRTYRDCFTLLPFPV